MVQILYLNCASALRTHEGSFLSGEILSRITLQVKTDSHYIFHSGSQLQCPMARFQGWQMGFTRAPETPNTICAVLAAICAVLAAICAVSFFIFLVQKTSKPICAVLAAICAVLAAICAVSFFINFGKTLSPTPVGDGQSHQTPSMWMGWKVSCFHGNSGSH